MKNLLNPRWLFIINTLPVCILFYIFYQEYSVIKTLLDEENINYWFIFGGTLAILTIANAIYAFFDIHKKKEVSGIYAGISLCLHIIWIYTYTYNISSIVPFNIPRWMFSGNTLIYACTFIMPTLAYNLLVLVNVLTTEPERRNPIMSVAAMILVPLSFYLFYTLILPLFEADGTYISDHFFIIGIIAGTLFFLFSLCRIIYIVIAKKSEKWKRYELLWKIPITLVLPLLGLMLNNGVLFGFRMGGSGFFGDFTNHWFYILAIINGILVCLPNLPKKDYRIILFLLRCLTFSYTVYFFFVFLPYLPLSVIAVIAFGLGFLMLAPLLLFLIHANEIYTDFGYLKQYHSVVKLVIVGVVGFAVIPVLITITFMQDKKTLHQALEYVYQPDYSKNYRIDKESLINTLYTVEEQRGNDNSFLWSSYYMPFITPYFNWLVMDNLTLSERRIKDMKYIFFGEKDSYNPDLVKYDLEERGSKNVAISNATTSSRYDKNAQAWISTVDIEITNYSQSNIQEYATQFIMPDGCWISDYYLYVDDKKEPGILSEKRAAMWVYSQIVNTNRDPGILYYNMGNRIVFKVFPFSGNEVRRTGIEFMHKEPFTLKLDGYDLIMGNYDNKDNIPVNAIEVDNSMYIPAAVKKNMDITVRRPYFHFILDSSVEARNCRDSLLTMVRQLADQYPSLADGGKITLSDTYSQTNNLDGGWDEVYEQKILKGGFFLDRALKKIFAEDNNSDRYPVIVVLTNNIKLSLMDKNYADFKSMYPESDHIFVMNSTGNMKSHSLLNNTYFSTHEAPFPPIKEVRVYRTKDGKAVYLRNNDLPDVILKNKTSIPNPPITEKSWETGLLMQGYYMSQLLSPDQSGKEWRKLLAMSFGSGIMNPNTSYMVVENEAQKAALKRKQEQVLKGSKLLDLDEEDAVNMSEPEFYILLFILGLVIWINRKRYLRV